MLSKFHSWLLGLFLFFAAPLFAQDVCIKPSTARYFLEQDDLVWTLTKKDSLNQQLISNLNESILYKDQIINTYRSDSSTYNQIISNKDSIIQNSEKEVFRLKRTNKLLTVGIVLAVVLGLL